MILYMKSPSNFPWYSESSPARVRNFPWFSQKFPCYGFKIPPGLLTLSVSLEPHIGRQTLEVTSEMTYNKTHTKDRRHVHTPVRGTELGKKLIAIYYKSPLGRIPDCMNKHFQHSAGAYMLPYSKGEWNPCLLQSLSKALFSFLSQEGNAPSYARDH